MEERNRSFNLHGQQRIEKYEKAWEVLMKVMQRQPVEECMHAACSVEGAWKLVKGWYQPQGDAERDHLEK